MKRYTMLAASGVALLLAACAPPADETYPLTGATCGPDDPVKELDALDCVPT